MVEQVPVKNKVGGSSPSPRAYMKQHITIEQYNELSDGEKNLLSYWVVDHPNGCCAPHITEIYDGDALLNIGQMIEFLDERYENFDLATGGSGWMVYYKKGVYETQEELCDALWEAVKEVLEKK